MNKYIYLALSLLGILGFLIVHFMDGNQLFLSCVTGALFGYGTTMFLEMALK